MSDKIYYENGNKNSPVLVLGDDPSNGTEGYEKQDNVIVSRLPAAVSVPRNSVSSDEGTPVNEHGLPLSAGETHENAPPADSSDEPTEEAETDSQ